MEGYTVLGVNSVNFVRMSLIKLINKFNTIPIKIPAGTFKEIHVEK